MILLFSTLKKEVTEFKTSLLNYQVLDFFSTVEDSIVLKREIQLTRFDSHLSDFQYDTVCIIICQNMCLIMSHI